MYKFSIIIPTLQKNTTVLNLLLEQLIKDSNIDEIIVIDNSLKGLNVTNEKLRIIIPDENLYVNPAWNLGVKEAENQYIGLVNDDMIFSNNFFDSLVNFIETQDNIGIIGLDFLSKTSLSDFNSIPIADNINYVPVGERNICFGCAMFFDKNNYNFIPDELKVWFGDDYIFDKAIQNNLVNYKIENSNVKHLHSNTSKLPEFDKIKDKDMLAYIEINPEFKKKIKHKELTFLEKIFSIRNEYILTQKYKLLSIFGLKFILKKERE